MAHENILSALEGSGLEKVVAESTGGAQPESYARMAAVSVDSGFDMPRDALRGPTTLEAYIRDLVAAS